MATIEPVSAANPAPGTPGVVFVHGLSGDPWATWTVPGAGWEGERFWPRWLAREWPSLAIWTLGYAAPKSRWPWGGGHALPLYDRARELLDRLDLIVGERPLVFVAHSLGGLIVKELLRTARDEPAQYGWLVRATRGVIFLGTPHRGAWAASAMNRFVPLLTSAAIRDLEAHDAHLRQLNRWFTAHAPGLGIRTASHYETRPLRGLLVVDQDSADPGIAGAPLIAVDADHHHICKPADPGAHVYQSVRRFVTDWLGTPNVHSAPGSTATGRGGEAPPAKGHGRDSGDLRTPALTHAVRSLVDRLAAEEPRPGLAHAVPADPERLKVFVSSAMVSGQLDGERRAAIATIDGVGFARAWAWERESAGGPSVAEDCVAHAAESDGLVLILAGELTPIARQEYRAARDCGRACYILLKEGFRPSPAMEDFLEREGNSVTVARFGNLAELETRLVDALYADVVRVQRAAGRGLPWRGRGDE